MTSSEEAPSNNRSIEPAPSFRDEALRLINLSLEEARTQHPLDIPQIFNIDRPSMGDMVPIKLYRAVRLIAFRELMGSQLSSAVLQVAGQMLAGKLGVSGLTDAINAIEDLGVGKPCVQEQSDERLVLTLEECATCSGAPNIGEPLCYFEAGFLEAALSGNGTQFTVTETQCWGLGDKICVWEAVPTGEKAPANEPIELLAALAGKAADALDNAVTITERSRLLRRAYHDLLESERLKQDLIDMIIHDMRTPLAASIGSMQTLAETASKKLAPQEDAVLRMAIHSAQTLLGMINDLLDIRKLEANALILEKSTAPVDELVQEAVDHVGILAKRKRISLVCEIPVHLPLVMVDRDRVVRVITNLLSNAVRHTHSGGMIKIEANTLPEESAVVVHVTDTGEGIPKEYLPRIFDKFVQVDTHASRRKLSTGLGLTFCKLVVEAHGGRIWAESEPGKGSTFSFTLPV